MSGAPPTSTPPPGARSLWGSYGDGGAPAPSGSSSLAPTGFGGEPLDPLSRRLMYGVKFLSLLLLLVVANSFVNDGEETLEFNPVAAAAERMEKCPGARFSVYVVYSSPALPQSIAASGSGAYNAKTERSRATLEMNNPLLGSFRMVQINDGDVEYLSGDTVEDKLPPGKDWVRTDADAPEDDEASLNIDDSLRMLRSSGEVGLVGREAINGKMTRRYRGEVKIGDLVDFLREKGRDKEAESYEQTEGLAVAGISVETWVDRKSLLRRLRMVMPMPTEPGEPAMTVDMRMDFFDYGAQPDIQLPSPDSVVEGPLEDEEPLSSSSIS